MEISIVGAGGHGRELASIALAQFGPECRISFWDDAVAIGEHGFGLVRGTPNDLIKQGPELFAVGVGDPRIRAMLVKKLETAGGTPQTLVHPTASIGPQCCLDPGAVIGASSVLTTGVAVGSHAHVHSQVVIAHDCEVQEYALITPSVALAGDVVVGPFAWIGIAACINRGVKIGRGAVVGAGAAVLSDVPAGTTVVGVPARPIEKRWS